MLCSVALGLLLPLAFMLRWQISGSGFGILEFTLWPASILLMGLEGNHGLSTILIVFAIVMAANILTLRHGRIAHLACAPFGPGPLAKLAVIGGSSLQTSIGEPPPHSLKAWPTRNQPAEATDLADLVSHPFLSALHRKL